MNAGFIEELYAQYVRDPASVPEDWRGVFAALGEGAAAGPGSAGSATGSVGAAATPATPATGLGSPFQPHSLFNPPGAAAGGTAELLAADLQRRISQLVRNYRVRGHRLAKLDPLGLAQPERIPELELGYYGLSEADLSRPVAPDTIPGCDVATVGDVLSCMQATYCRSIGAQFMHIDDVAVRDWLRDRMEYSQNRLELSRDEQLRILTRLTDAVIFEAFIQQKYVGAKSFSLEGAESLIPLLDLAIEKAAEQGIDEIVLAMAHRGRLNVLANILHKHPQAIFREFDDRDPELYIGRGDVKYHLGYSSDWTSAAGRKVHLSLCFNPSHLEFVNPVALGRLRAKQDRHGDRTRERGLALLIHGDAAFIGEGVTQETLNLSELAGYEVGGALHVILNNQIGFTTGPQQGRSSTYASDVAKMLQSPIWHVNGEDPEAVAQVIRLALDFRREFRRDVVVDMYGYRRRGHNEGDEPAYTQPLLYEAIRRRKSVREGYLEHLLKLGGVTKAEADEIARVRRDRLEQALAEARAPGYRPARQEPKGLWQGYTGGPASAADTVDTGVPEARLQAYLAALTQVPEGFSVHPKLERFMAARREMAQGERPVDWATAEALALASLAAEGRRVRLSGQDTERGTFSQRHARLHDPKTGASYMPLAHVTADQAPVEIVNSPLSELGVMGFEYGYSLDWPDGLVAWEAQFGDFANAAQVIIDQFLAGAEEKWNRLSGLVLLLPHGAEGTGPEHASARMERFLSLAAEANIQVAMPTTPAQMFHLLRRQVLRKWRKPLVVMTPKSLLRHSDCVSPLADLAAGGFAPVLGDAAAPRAVARVLLCSGKVYYELAQRRSEGEHRDVALVRLEELYPLDEAALGRALDVYGEAPIVYVQEEPANMGAWPYLRGVFGEKICGRPLAVVARPASASPATGSAASHKRETEQLLAAAFSVKVGQPR
ncbi:MAG TPA: 2-oxoglutarate dehydrogenase E1 component [Limnochordia bacterium]|nr:2-oxoglutarate dehydrogenase E1 component [Limnochordia bacterium]